MSRLDDLLDACPELMKAGDVAKLLGVSSRTVQNWLKEEALPGIRIAGTWVVVREELRQWLHEAHNQRGRGAAPPDPEG